MENALKGHYRDVGYDYSLQYSGDRDEAHVREFICLGVSDCKGAYSLNATFENISE